MQNRRHFLCSTYLAAMVALTAGLTTPASGDETKLKVQLAWLPNAASAGEIVALQKGFFKERGLDVELLPGGPGSNTVQELLSGTTEISVAYAPQIMYAAHRNLPIISFAAAFQKAPLTFVSLGETNIKSVADWAGKRVGAAQDAIPQITAVLQNNGLEFEDITFVQAQVPALLQGQVDIIATWLTNVAQNEPVFAHEGGFNAQSIWDNGLQFQSNYYITRKDYLEDHSDTLIAFLEAVDKGWAFAADHPEQAVGLMVEYAPALEADKELASLNVITSDFIYTDETVTERFGNISPERWQQTLDTYAGIGEIRSDLTADDVLDRRILDAAERTNR